MKNFFKVNGEISELIPLASFTEIKLPLFASPIVGGFASPAEDYIAGHLDLNKELIKHPEQTFLGRAASDSMEPDIYEGELLVIDAKVDIHPGNIILAELNGEFCMKEFRQSRGEIILLPRNPNYDPIIVTEQMRFRARGRIMYSIKEF
jgi:DNA polymerase V